MDTPKSSTIEPLNVFERKNSKNISQAIGFVIILFLNVSLVGSDIHVSIVKHVINWRNELMSLSFLTFLDCTVWLPIILQVRRLKMWDDKFVVQTLFWTSRLNFDQVTGLENPRSFAVSILKTRKMFYLITWKDLPDIGVFLTKVKEKLG